jgi:tripartite-type tricarboxylate transporter receptor subunit TctC
MNSPIKTLPELLENLRNTKQKINIGTGGSANLLIYKYLINNLNIDKERVQLIPYNSPMAATIAAGAGDIDLAIVTVSSVKSLIGTKVRLLAISGGNKIDSLDRVPLIKDFIPGLVWDSSWVVFLPPNAPQEVRNWYNKQFKQALESAAAKKYFNDNWAVIDERTITSAGLTADIVLLKKKWLPIAKTVLVDNK